MTYLCSIPLDFGYVPMHWHDEMEIIYIKKGNGTITVDFTQHTVSAGDIALILPGQLHSIGQFESESMEYENIIFHPNMLISKKTDMAGQSVRFAAEFPVQGTPPAGVDPARTPAEVDFALTLSPAGDALHLVPRIGVLGIGCRRGTCAEQLEAAFTGADQGYFPGGFNLSNT